MSLPKWHRSEWHDSDEAVSMYHGGYEADVYPVEPIESSETWFASVKATSETSEWPELIDAQHFTTRGMALEWAEEKIEATAAKRKEPPEKCTFGERPMSWQAAEVGCPLDHCSCNTHDAEQLEHTCPDQDRWDDEFADIRAAERAAGWDPNP